MKTRMLSVRVSGEGYNEMNCCFIDVIITRQLKTNFKKLKEKCVNLKNYPGSLRDNVI